VEFQERLWDGGFRIVGVMCALWFIDAILDSVRDAQETRKLRS
jgi:hypothetical protein